MSLFRSVLLASLISLAAAFGLLFLGSGAGYEEFRGGYAVLQTDASVDDRLLRSILEEGEIYFGGTPESESSQWVFLDEFDSIQIIPLDKFSERIFPFDPRNDGYADLLRNVFVRNERRYIYIPLQAGNWNIKLLDRQFDQLLEDIPFSVEYYGVGRPLYFFFISYAAASLCLFIICLIFRKKTFQTAGIIALIPVFSSLAFFGAPGIACAALLIAFFIILKDPLNELATPQRSLAIKTLFRKIVYPYRFHLISIPVFAAALFILIYYSQLKLLFLTAVFTAALVVFILTLRIMSLSRSEHKKFNPILILKSSSPELIFSVYMMPFTVAAFIVMLFAPHMSASYNTNRQFNNFVDEHDYYAHLNYQAAFSTRQINTSSMFFPSFFIDTDGLPSMADNNGYAADINDFPSFPLQNLMDFFHTVNSNQRVNSGNINGIFADFTLSTEGFASGIGENLSLLVLLLFIIPGMFLRREKFFNTDSDSVNRKNTNNFLHGKLRLAGINRNSKSVYNTRNPSHSQSDTVSLGSGWRSQKDA